MPFISMASDFLCSLYLSLSTLTKIKVIIYKKNQKCGKIVWKAGELNLSTKLKPKTHRTRSSLHKLNCHILECSSLLLSRTVRTHSNDIRRVMTIIDITATSQSTTNLVQILACTLYNNVQYIVFAYGI